MFRPNANAYFTCQNKLIKLFLDRINIEFCLRNLQKIFIKSNLLIYIDFINDNIIESYIFRMLLIQNFRNYEINC